MKTYILPLAVILLGAVLSLSANAMQPPQMSVENAYAYATTPVQKNGAVFFEITSHSETADKIIKATADVAERVELHTHTMDGGTMMMREVESYEIPAGGTTTLEPTGHHIMLMGLSGPLKAGESFPLTLEFENHWPLEINVQIKNPGDVK